MVVLEDIGQGPLGHVLSHLSAKDLSSAACVNRSFQRIANDFCWTDLDWRLGSEGQASGEAKNIVERCHRFFQAQQYAIQMEQLASQHYDFESPSRALVKQFSSTCNFPMMLHTKAFRFVDNYEFFVRLSHMKTQESTTDVQINLYWEGFLPASKTSYNEICLDLSVLEASTNWRSTWTKEMEKLTLTVVALEKASTFSSRPLLVVATGGIESKREEEADFDEVDVENNHLESLVEEQVYSLHPRNVRSRGIRSDEDWIGVDIRSIFFQQPRATRVHGNEYTFEQQRVSRIVLSHQW